MFKMRVVAAIVALSILLSVPCGALASAQNVAKGPVVAVSATALSADELAKYGQMQTNAQQNGVLKSEKGGTDATTWTIVGIVAIVVIGVGLGVAIATAD
ncbi:MAG TPA: hypothetical protein VHP11_02115 [Tepidisphaeraceae bacterium]|nr:hypothetical protein [Tepidisphaeraceae bacterium]